MAVCGLVDVEREKFAPHVMVPARVCVGGKGHLYFFEWEGEGNRRILTWKNCCQSWSKIVNSCYQIVSSSMSTALRLTRHAGWSQTTATSSPSIVPPKFTRSQSSRLSRLREATLESYYKLQPKPKRFPELKDALHLIWSAMLQKSIDIAACSERLPKCPSTRDLCIGERWTFWT